MTGEHTPDIGELGSWSENIDRIVEYVARYGGRCRDCADHDGVCPTRGLPCAPEDRDTAIRHVIEALDYGAKHGFVPPSRQQEN